MKTTKIEMTKLETSKLEMSKLLHCRNYYNDENGIVENENVETIIMLKCHFG